MARLGAGPWQVVSSRIEPDWGPGRFSSKKPTLGRSGGRWQMRIDRADDDEGRTPSVDVPDAQEASPVRDTPVTREVPDGDDASGGQGARGARDADGDGGRAVRVARTLEYRATVDAAVRVHAIDKAYEKISEIERGAVTPAMKRIEAEDPDRRLAGLENRLKGKDRLTAKVDEAVDERGRTVNEALGMVKDAIRYTLVYAEDRYAEGVHADCERLEDAGFERFDRKNSWDGQEYKGVNGRWRVPGSGQLFEVQFHTQSSLDAKEETHAAYECLRTLPEDDAEVGQSHAYQREVTAKVPVPPGALDIPDYR